MNYLREYDSECRRLASEQGYIFSLSVKEKLPSFYFAKVLVNTEEIKLYDDLSYKCSGISREELFLIAKNKLRMKRGTIYSFEEMNWIGYFYRTYCYLFNISSSKAFKDIPISFLRSVYYPYHSLDIRKAIDMVIKNLNINEIDNEERAYELVRKIYKTA